MNGKIITLIALSIFSLSFRFASADLKINEIFYSPVSNQWIEVYNDSDVGIDITKYKILDNGAQKNGHGISAEGEVAMVGPHTYVVVAKNPGSFNFSVWKSALGIKASGDTVILRDSSGEMSDDTVYVADGSATGGLSLQLIGGSWVVSTPTPGQENSQSSSSGNDNSSDGGSDSTSDSDEEEEDVVAPKTKVELSVDSLAYVGIPHSFYGKITQGNNHIRHGRYFWNFGDGDFTETNVTHVDKFTHTYFYPGDYSVLFEYYPDFFAEEPEVSQKIVIKVIDPTVVITRVGDARDFFVELSNNANYEVEMSGWLLRSDLHEFKFPKNTTIGAKKKMIISGRISGLVLSDLPSLRLTKPSGEVVFQYFTPPVTRASNTKFAPRNTVSQSSAVPEKLNSELTASSALYDAEEIGVDGAEEESSPIVYITSLAGLLGAGLYTVRKIRRSGDTQKLGDDFKIIE